MLGPKQESIRWMMDFGAKFSGLWYLVVDIDAGTIAVAKACMHLSQHMHFVGCKMDEGCVKEALLGLVEVHALRVLSSRSDKLRKKKCA